MKRFLISCFSISLLAAGLLFFKYNYRPIVILYHLFVMGGILSLFAVFISAVAVFIKKKNPATFFVSFSAGLFFFLFLLFYVLVFVSNHFWHKTITLSILKNYISSFGDILNIIPVQKEIVIGFLLFYLLVTILLYLFIRPRREKIIQQVSFIQKPRLRKKLLAGFALLVVMLFAFYKPLLQMKRIIHMAEEPFLQFTLGGIWGNDNEIAFDKFRYENGLKDKPCIDSIQPNATEHTTVIILIDGLRADHLPMYGYARNTAPFLDSLYQQKELLAVENAFSLSTNTIGGIAGLFFSKDWMEFGFNGLSLMKFFKKAGYSTYAFLTGFHRDWYGLSALYRENCDVYYESTDNPDVKNDDDLVTLKKITQTTIPKKSFVFIHLLSVHLIGKKNEEFKKFLPDKIGFGVDKKTALVNNYDNGILQSDFVIRKIFEKLKQENILENSTIYVLSDHGELFGENGGWGHGGNIDENLLWVPLLIYDKKKDWYTNLETVTLKDVAPTIADRIGSPIPFCWEGRSMHLPAQNFTVEATSAEVCSLPYGILSKTDSTIKLKIMNEKKEVVRTVVKKDSGWVNTDN